MLFDNDEWEEGGRSNCGYFSFAAIVKALYGRKVKLKSILNLCYVDFFWTCVSHANIYEITLISF